MDLDDTLAFVAVVRAGGFTAAGRRLGIPKSTLSRRVARLEEHLGVALLKRTTRRIGLTDAGEGYFARCSAAIDTIDAAERAVRAAADAPRGTLRLTAPFDLGRVWLPGVLAGFRRLYPDVRVALELTQRRVDLIAEDVDVALRGGSLPDSSLVARKLATSIILLAASPAYLAAHGAPATPADLVDHAFLSFGAPFPPRLPLRSADQRLQIDLDAAVTANEFGVLRALAAEGLGIAILERTTTRDAFTSGALVRVLPEWEIDAPPGGLYAVYTSRKGLDPKVRAFVDYAADRAAEQLF